MALKRLDSQSAEEAAIYTGRTDSQLRDGIGKGDAGGLFVAESMNVIERAIDSGIEPVSILLEECWLEHERRLVERFEALWPDKPLYVLTHQEFKELTGYQITRGALGAFKRPTPPSLEDLLANSERVALFENITNYTNIGQMFRSAAALGVDAILLSPQCHDPLYRRASRVSMGTVFQVPWLHLEETAHGSWPDEALATIKSQGFTVVAMALRENALSLGSEQFPRTGKLALMFGTEGEGLTEKAIEAADLSAIIPMHAGADSLNVAACAAIAFWETRVREEPDR